MTHGIHPLGAGWPRQEEGEEWELSSELGLHPVFEVTVLIKKRALLKMHQPISILKLYFS